jgi:hypothetical protein
VSRDDKRPRGGFCATCERPIRCRLNAPDKWLHLESGITHPAIPQLPVLEHIRDSLDLGILPPHQATYIQSIDDDIDEIARIIHDMREGPYTVGQRKLLSVIAMELERRASVTGWAPKKARRSGEAA